MAAPWHLGNRLHGADTAAAVLGAAIACAKGDADDGGFGTGVGDSSGARRAWVSFLNSSVDVLLTHAAPGMGGAVGDAARLGCLGRLALTAGVTARLVELPTIPSAALLAGGTFLQTASLTSHTFRYIEHIRAPSEVLGKAGSETESTWLSLSRERVRTWSVFWRALLDARSLRGGTIDRVSRISGA